MPVSIDHFLAAGTGPTQLRAALHLQTAPLRNLHRRLAAIDTLETRVPRAVLGGDLLDVLSERLQHYLLEPELPRSQARVPGGRTAFPALPTPSRAPGTAFASPPHAPSPRRSFGEAASDEATPSGFPALPADSERGESSLKQPPRAASSEGHFADVPPAAPRTRATHPTASFAASPVVPRSEAEAARQEASPAAARASSEAMLSGPEHRAPNAASRLSLLVAKLEAYERHSRSYASTPALRPPPGGFGVPPAAERASRFATPMPTPGFSAPRAWADDTGAQLARALRPVTDGSDSVSVKRVQQTVQTGAPERVEVQNFFNVEVHTQGGAAGTTLTNLSEKIAEILREQAIQHGIDLS